MKLLDTILAEHSKSQVEKIVHWVGSSQQRFDQLYANFLHGEPIVKQRAAWPLSYIVQDHPGLIRKHFASFTRNLEQPGLHDAVKRNSLRLLQEISIPKRFHGRIMSLCFDFLTDPAEKPAIKAFSMTVLENLSRHYPDIRNELRLILESQWDQESAAFKSRARKILGPTTRR